MSLCVQVLQAKSLAAAERILKSFLALQPFNTALPHCVTDLLQFHARWADKTARGFVRAEKIAVYGAFALSLVLSDATRESICWKHAAKCLRNGGQEDLADKRCEIREAFREAVRPQIQAARAALGGCVGDGKEVDHLTDFAVLVREFLAKEGVEFDNVATEKPIGQRRRLVDRGFEARWLEHHAARATYQLVTHEEHVRITQVRKTFGRAMPL